MTAREHPAIHEWARLLDGEVTANRAAQMEAHAAACNQCEREIARLTTLIGEIERPAVDVCQPEVSAIMARLDEGAAPQPIARSLIWSAAAVAAAAAALVIVALSGGGQKVSRTEPGTFSPRGHSGTGDDLSRMVGFAFYSGADANAELGAGASISADSPLTATYRNLGERAVYALIFVVDSAGEIHWLYPAYTDPDSDPRSVELLPGQRAGQFGQTVVLDEPSPGPMRVFTVVSGAAHNVSSVENLAAGERTVDGIQNRFPDAAVSALAIEVSH